MRTNEYGVEIMTMEEFAETYKAVKKPNTESDYLFYKHNDADMDFVLAQDPECIWTLKSFNGVDELEAGYLRIDALGYVVVENPEIVPNSIIIVYGYELYSLSMEETMDFFLNGYYIIPNHIHPENGFLFKDTTEEVKFVKAQGELRVWEYYYDENSKEYSVFSGYKEYEPKGNFLGYFVGEVDCNFDVLDCAGVVIFIKREN